jgi:hypothetical protein
MSKIKPSLSTREFGTAYVTQEWSDSAEVVIEIDGELFAVERIMRDESSGDLIIVGTPND